MSTELPPCKGPKLKRFEHHNRPIEWLERLGAGGDGDAGSVAKAYVFRARIEGQEYAVKVFKFFDPRSQAYYWGPLLGSSTDLNTAAYYTDPFYAECRAHGAIEQAIAERRLREDAAVRCHGYLFLSDADQRRLLENEGLDLGFDNLNTEYQKNAVGDLRVRAIVKDLASNDPGVETKRLRTILARIKALNKLGIYIRDIELETFRDGKVVNLGVSWTEPHALLDAWDGEAASGFRLADRVGFEGMLRNRGIPYPGHIRATRNIAYCKKLRPRGGRVSGAAGLQGKTQAVQTSGLPLDGLTR